MRKLFTLFALMAMTAANAAPVTPSKALLQAKQFCQGRESKGLMKASSKSEMKVVYTSENAEYYVVSRGENAGYVIVAGDDCSPSILGHVDSGNFCYDELPDGLKDMLASYAEQVTASASLGIKYTASSKADHAKIGPLLTTEWGQKSPFNDLSPVLNSTTTQRYASGCVATAMAQVLNYHKWATKVTGNGTAICAAKKLTLDMDGDVIDYSKMLDKYTIKADTVGAGTAEQRAEVAKLLHDLAFSVNMDWSGTSGGTSQCLIPSGLYNHWGVDKGIHCVHRILMDTDEEWDSLLYAELSTNGPVLYAGRNFESGHSFVCDGYSGNGMYHFNWGWYGMSNGDFLLSALNPKHVSNEGKETIRDYTSDQRMILGLCKPQADSKFVYNVWHFNDQPDFQLTEDGNEDTVIPRVQFDSAIFPKKVTFGFQATNLATNEVKNYECTDTLLAPGYPEKIYMKVPAGLSDGKYRMNTVFKVDDDDWQLCKYAKGTNPSFVLEVKDGKKSYSVEEDFALSYLYMSSTLYSGSCNITIRVISNHADHSADFYYKVVDYETKDTLNVESNHQKVDFTFKDCKKEISFELPDNNELKAGKNYYLVLFDGNRQLHSNRRSCVERTAISNLSEDTIQTSQGKVYNLQGICVANSSEPAVLSRLHRGIYIVNGKKFVVK